MKIIFNGAIFSTGRKDGIPRFTTEMLKALDRIVNKNEVELVTPVDIDFELQNIKIVKYCESIYKAGRIGGELWRQICIIRYAGKDSIIVDLGMMLPFFRNDVCAIYDCQPEKYPDNYKKGRMSGLARRIRLLQRKHAILKSELIITDSNDAANDIVGYYGVDRDKIKVVYCGWQHFNSIKLDETIFDEFSILTDCEYFFSLGSRFKHKNIEWVLEAARQNPKYLFVITGDDNAASYSSEIIKQPPQNVIFTGFLSDGKVKALMKHCKAFIHPSFNEGFGMPPLEALSVGAELIVSNVSCLPEVYRDCAHYIDPFCYEKIDIEKILSDEIVNPSRLLREYSWDKSAKELLTYINTLKETGKRSR